MNRAQITAAAVGLAAVLAAGCSSHPVAGPDLHTQRMHAVQVCDGLASAAARETGNQIGAADWQRETDAAVGPTVGTDAPAGYVTTSMFLAIADVMAPGAPGSGPGLPSASAVRALQAACDAVDVTAPVWPRNLIR